MRMNIIKISLITFAMSMGIFQAVIGQADMKEAFDFNLKYSSSEPGYSKPHILFENNHQTTLKVELYTSRNGWDNKETITLGKDKSEKVSLPAKFTEDKEDVYLTNQTLLKKIVIIEPDGRTQTKDFGDNPLQAIPVYDGKGKFTGFFAWKLVKQKDGNYRLCVRNDVKLKKPCEML